MPFLDEYSSWTLENGNGIRNNEFASLQIQELIALVRQPIIGAIAARLARTKTIRLLDDQLIFKPPGDEIGHTTVGWHADHAYWATCSSNNLITTWIPFHNIDERRAPLVILNGSHNWPGLDHSRFFTNPDLKELESHFRQKGRDLKPVTIKMKKGYVSFHHCWALHASLPSSSDSFILSMAIHLQDAANAYRPYNDASGKEIHIIDEAICRRLPNSDPDFGDPEFFPILWSEPNP